MKTEAEIRKALGSWRSVANMKVEGSGLPEEMLQEMHAVKHDAKWFVNALEWVLGEES